MKKPPKLTIVKPGSKATATGIQPTRSLGSSGFSLWQRIQAEVTIEDAGSIEILMQICEALDRAQELAALIKEEGCTVRTKVGRKSNPALKDEMACRAFITRNLQRLGLNLEPVKEIGRPSGFSPSTRGEDC